VPLAETAFRVVYDGPALVSGRMSVRDLAPALIALGDLFAEASEVIYPEGKPVALNIQATEEGSFDVHLILESLGPWEDFKDLFGGDAVTALVNLKTLLIGGPSIGLFELIRIMAGRTVEREEPLGPGEIRITYSDGTVVEVPSQLAQLAGRFTVRKKARDVIAPLSKDGVERVKFTDEPTAPPTVVIEQEDLPAYQEAATATDEEEVLLDEEREMVVQIASVSFEGRPWRLSEGELTFPASIEDSEFLERVHAAREEFAEGDLLRCRVRVIQTRRPDGKLKPQYRVIQVIDHIPAATQMRLDET
jgi:hypothetical protein